METFICQRFGFRTVDRNSKNGQEEDFNMHEETIQITWLDKNFSDQCDNRTELKLFFSVKEFKVGPVGS